MGLAASETAGLSCRTSTLKDLSASSVNTEPVSLGAFVKNTFARFSWVSADFEA